MQEIRFLLLLFLLLQITYVTSSANFASTVTSSASTGKHAALSTSGKALSTSASTAGDASSLSTTASTSTSTRAVSSSSRASTAATSTSATASTTSPTTYRPEGDPCSPLIVCSTFRKGSTPTYAPIGEEFGIQVFHNTGDQRNLVLAGALQRNDTDPIPRRSVLSAITAVTSTESCDYYEADLWLSWGELMCSGLYTPVVPLGGQSSNTFTYDETGLITCALALGTSNNPIYLWKSYTPSTPSLITAIHVTGPRTAGDNVVVEIPLAGATTSLYELRDANYWTEKLYLLWATQMCVNWATHRTLGNYTLGSVSSRPLICAVNNGFTGSSAYAGTVEVWWEQINANHLGVMAQSDVVTTSGSDNTPVLLARVPLQQPLAASYYNASLLQITISNAMCNLFAQMVLVAGGNFVVMEDLIQSPQMQEKLLAMAAKQRPGEQQQEPDYHEEAQALYEAHRAQMGQRPVASKPAARSPSPAADPWS